MTRAKDMSDFGVSASAGAVIKKTYYSIGRGTYTHSQFPFDDTIPLRDEGSEIFSQAYTPSTSNCNLFITTYVKLGESSNVANDMQLGLFMQDLGDASLHMDALIVGEHYSQGADMFHNGNIMLMHSMSSWGTSAKTFSLRASGGNTFNYSNRNAVWATATYGGVLKSAFIVEEVAT